MTGSPEEGAIRKSARAEDNISSSRRSQTADAMINKNYNFPEEKKMAVKIRLRRMGKKKAPFYRVVVADSRYPRDGRFIEEIGTYNPLVEEDQVKIDAEAAKKWIGNGAQPTDTVRALLKKQGII